LALVNPTLCLIEGCERRAVCRKVCFYHYHLYRNSGRLQELPKTGRVKIRFHTVQLDKLLIQRAYKLDLSPTVLKYSILFAGMEKTDKRLLKLVEHFNKMYHSETHAAVALAAAIEASKRE